jgi:hypothetical protein
LNADITDATSVEKELMLSPLGIEFEPLGADDDGVDDPQAAAVSATIAPAATHATRRVLLFRIPHTPFAWKTPE